MNFLSAWKALFDRFDTDETGFIDLPTFQDTLTAFGYRLSKGMMQDLFERFVEPNSKEERMMAFDRFVVTYVALKKMTDIFKKFDDDRDGYITLSLYGTSPIPHVAFYDG